MEKYLPRPSVIVGALDSVSFLPFQKKKRLNARCAAAMADDERMKRGEEGERDDVEQWARSVAQQRRSRRGSGKGEGCAS